MDPLSRLARQARAGDARALEAFVDVAYEQVWRLCAALVDEQSADDLAQDTFVRAVRSLPRYRGESSAQTWLLAIARHACLDELRARIRRRRLDRDTALDEPATADSSEELAVADLVGRLEPDRRAAFVLTQLIGLSYEETAQVCDCPVGTIRSRVARARADLLRLRQQGGRRRPGCSGWA